MGTTTTRAIPLPLVFNINNPRYADNRATLYTALNAGWVTLCYRKADGTTVSRMATRNPTLVKAFGTDDDVEALGVSDHYPASILYFDYAAGALRSFRVDGIFEAFIPADPPEMRN